MKELNQKCKIPRLFEIMEKKGIKGAEIAKVAGVSAGNVSDWKSGKAKPNAEKINKLSNFLNVSVSYLLGETDEKKPASEETDTNENNLKVALFGVDDGEVTDEMWDEVKKYAEYLKNKYKK